LLATPIKTVQIMSRSKKKEIESEIIKRLIAEFVMSGGMIGARVKVKLNNENGMPIIKSGKLIEILEEWS